MVRENTPTKQTKGEQTKTEKGKENNEKKNYWKCSKQDINNGKRRIQANKQDIESTLAYLKYLHADLYLNICTYNTPKQR